MENSAYVTNPLQPSTLVVFSQSGSGPDALALQRNYNRGEDSSNSRAGFGLRLMESCYPGLPATHLLHLQPHLFQTAASAAAVPFSVNSTSASGPSSSAFGPPPLKSLKLERLLSPITVSISPSPTDELTQRNSNTPASDLSSPLDQPHHQS
ncbi:hypothetical protein O3M35_004510 [Rhynocoris fuscipes]|uniref:Uncharacterized protein n=1 Tax=Rhynocoris fuscipes TaxID=488301 RepID=A0AAW1CER4_9HEMI